MILQEDGISDPPGIKLRAMEGLYGCAYLEPSNRATKALSYVFGPFFEMLQDVIPFSSFLIKIQSLIMVNIDWIY